MGFTGKFYFASSACCETTKCVLLVPIHLEIFKKFRLLKNKMNLRTFESRSLMPFLNICVIEIAKIKPRKILSN